MITRRCAHCESEIEVPADGRVMCPVCGLDVDLPPIAITFDDAPAYFLSGDPRLEPIPVEVPARLGS
jgi:hypothetical protein